MKLRIIELVQVAIRYSRRHERFLANAALCIFALALHQSAPGGFWRFDDGYHLNLQRNMPHGNIIFSRL